MFRARMSESIMVEHDNQTDNMVRDTSGSVSPALLPMTVISRETCSPLIYEHGIFREITYWRSPTILSTVVIFYLLEEKRRL